MARGASWRSRRWWRGWAEERQGQGGETTLDVETLEGAPSGRPVDRIAAADQLARVADSLGVHGERRGREPAGQARHQLRFHPVDFAGPRASLESLEWKVGGREQRECAEPARGK